jgi:hypothetical protein
VNRRAFLKRAVVGAGAVTGVSAAGWAYGRFEATWLHVVNETIAVPSLPA